MPPSTTSESRVVIILYSSVINEFIEKIIVHAPDRSEGDRMQEMEIYLKYIDRFAAQYRSLHQQRQSVRSSSAGFGSRARNATK